MHSIEIRPEDKTFGAIIIIWVILFNKIIFNHKSFGHS